MVVKLTGVITSIDTHISSGLTTSNFGLANPLIVGYRNATKKNCIILLKFTIPKYVGEMDSQAMRIKITGSGASPVKDVSIGIHRMKENEEDLWLEGTGTAGGTTGTEGATWLEYAREFDWETAGGDYEDEPIALEYAGVPMGPPYWFLIPIPKELLTFESGKTYSLIIKSHGSTTASNYVEIESITIEGPRLRLYVDVDGWDAPTLIAEPVSSSQINLSWNKTELADINFSNYHIEQSDTGVGGWSTLAIITDKDTTTYEHLSVVVQGDVDDYDEDSDTYPNGRTKYYRISVVSDAFGATGYGSVDATTIPAIRPVSLGLVPKSKYHDLNFIDDNLIYKPYGVEVIPSWYDINDITKENYIDKLIIDAYFRQTTSWPGTPSETNDFSPVDFADGGIVEGDIGYKPYKIKGKIFDTGGLYRKATTNKTTEQFEVVWPAPCPVAVPDGPYLSVPPDMGGPFDSGSLLPVDLSFAGQQEGSPIYEELFPGGDPELYGKWLEWFDVTPTTGAWSYGTGQGSRDVLVFNWTLNAYDYVHLAKKLWDEYSGDGSKNISKYTGGYKFEGIFRLEDWDTDNIDSLLNIRLCAWTHDHDLGSAGGGYNIEIQGPDTGTARPNRIIIRALSNFGYTPLGILSSHDYTPASEGPLDPSNVGKFIYVMAVVSPIFDASGFTIGDNILVVTKVNSDYDTARTIDWDTHSPVFIVQAVGKPSGEQPHYTGRCSINFRNADMPTASKFEIYQALISGRIGNVDALLGQGYGAKNITTGQVYGLSASRKPTFTIYCEPDQISQLINVEGRIKNTYGAQSRTGEVDDYQGDTLINALPTAVLITPIIGYKDISTTFNGTASTDPEGGDLAYEWDWGDGSPIEISIYGIHSHTYLVAGTYTIKLRVKDEAGLWSTAVEKIIRIYDVYTTFIPLTFICPEPFTAVNLIREDGDTETPMPGRPESYYQINDTGGRKFSITGQTVECANLSQQELIDNAKEEINMLDAYYSEGTLLDIDLPNYGIIKGFISGFRPVINEANPRFWTWSMTFKEVILL